MAVSDRCSLHLFKRPEDEFVPRVRRLFLLRNKSLIADVIPELVFLRFLIAPAIKPRARRLGTEKFCNLMYSVASPDEQSSKECTEGPGDPKRSVRRL